MARILVVCQRKGGVGKTTLSVNLAAELSRRRLDVGLVDADPQGSACHWAEPGNLAFPVYELHCDAWGVAEWAQEVRSLSHDFVVVDCPPGDRDLGAAMALADLAVVPCTPSGLDVEATASTLRIADAVRSRRAAPLSVLVVPNRVDMRSLEGQQLGQALAELGEPIASPIRSRSIFVRAFGAGTSIADAASGGRADQEMRDLCSRALKILTARSEGAAIPSRRVRPRP